MQHHPRARGSRGGQRPPAERRVQVVRVDHARAREADRAAHLRGREAAAQQPDRRARPSHRRRVSREQLRRLVQMLADQPQQVLHHALLAAGGAVAVVQKEDHR